MEIDCKIHLFDVADKNIAIDFRVIGGINFLCAFNRSILRQMTKTFDEKATNEHQSILTY